MLIDRTYCAPHWWVRYLNYCDYVREVRLVLDRCQLEVRRRIKKKKQ